jgi:hypothetical protein
MNKTLQSLMQAEKAIAMRANAEAAATIPDILWPLIAHPEVYLSLDTNRHWPIRWAVDEETGEYVPEYPIELEASRYWCWGGDYGKHLVCIETMDDLICASVDGVDECRCSDCCEDELADDEWRDLL